MPLIWLFSFHQFRQIDQFLLILIQSLISLIAIILIVADSPNKTSQKNQEKFIQLANILVGRPSKDLDLLANYNIITNSMSTRGRRSLGGMEECRGWEILFKQEHLYPVPCELWAAGGLGRVELWGKGRVLKSKLSDCCNLLSVLDTALEAKVLANKDESECLSLWLQ